MIGLIDVSIEYSYGIERVTLPFYSSSGTNNGKIKGLWYPIVGIKTKSGSFTEFTEYLNFVLTNTTLNGQAQKGWLAKSLFFHSNPNDKSKIMGFTGGRYYDSLLEIGYTLKDLYENNKYYEMKSLNSNTINKIITSKEVYPNNKHSQRENFEKFIQDIFSEIFFMDI
ncbi:MAG: hypothetical protein ACRC92_24790 [Peptostreptococcaceae bacterium]